MPSPPRSSTRGRRLPPGAGATARRNNAKAKETSQALEIEEGADSTVSVDVDQETADAKTWIKERVDQEVARIRATGTNIEPLSAKNFGIVVNMTRKKATAINRIEIDSTVDFKNVQQIMVSAGVPYPHKEGYEYVNVLLFVESMDSTPMLVPYLYDTKLKTQEPVENDDQEPPVEASSSTGSSDSTVNQRPWINVKNNLTEWLLVNAQNARARHRIDEFHDI